MSNPSIKARVVAQSKSAETNTVLTTLELTYPRFIHSELMTHRVFSRNAASSRAIPVEAFVRAVSTGPAVFSQYGKANKGMQAQELMEEPEIAEFLEDWTALSQQACEFALRWKDRAAKQMVNRALEPWMYMTTLVSGTDWNNFFALRAHPDAQPELQELAYKALHQYIGNVHNAVVRSNDGTLSAWHLPFIKDSERDTLLAAGDDMEQAIRLVCEVSAARVARVSYTKHGTQKDLADDLALAQRLSSSGHMSPFEHQARPTAAWETPLGNFRGWQQLRVLYPNQNRLDNLFEIYKSIPEWLRASLGPVLPPSDQQ